MASLYELMVVNRLLKDIMEKYFFFYGKVIALVGDFRQVLPVVPHGSGQLNIQNCIKYSPISKLKFLNYIEIYTSKQKWN
jgi:hypothetical protein